MKLEKYTGEKTYMFPNGALATPEIMAAKFPAAFVFAHVIETDEAGEVCFAVENLNALRTIHGIDSSLSEDEAIAAIEEIINAEPEVSTEATNEDITASSLASIAASLEYQNMMTLEDVETTEEV